MTDDWDSAMSKAAEIEKEAHRMTRKQTSPRVSSLAGKQAKATTPANLRDAILRYVPPSIGAPLLAVLDEHYAVHRSMAASLLSQDEVPKP